MRKSGDVENSLHPHPISYFELRRRSAANIPLVTIETHSLFRGSRSRARRISRLKIRTLLKFDGNETPKEVISNDKGEFPKLFGGSLLRAGSPQKGFCLTPPLPVRSEQTAGVRPTRKIAQTPTRHATLRRWGNLKRPL